MAGIQPDGGVPPSQTLNALSNPPLAAGCENLWHSIRCNPKFDPVAANAIISEILNVVALCASEGGTGTDAVYDCNRLDNLANAIQCIAERMLFGCLPQEFPSAEDACEIEQLVLATDAAGCQRIARYIASTSGLGSTTACSVQGAGTTRTVPLTPANPATFYTRASLSTAVDTGNVNEGLLQSNILGRLAFNLACTSTVELAHEIQAVVFDPAANAGNGAESFVVLRIDGEFILSPADAVVPVFAFTNFERSTSGSHITSLAAGAHVVEWFVIARDASRPPAQIVSGCGADGASSGSIFRANQFLA